MQDTVALSSGEAELKATCKGVAEGLGLQTLAAFLTQAPVPLEHFGDATAAFGILKREGSGALKHLDVRQLWVQEVVRRPGVSTVKIPRAVNLADALCSAQDVDGLHTNLARMGYRRPTDPSEGG